MRLLIMQFPPVSWHFLTLSSKRYLCHPLLEDPQSMFSFLIRQTKFHTLYKKQAKSYLIFNTKFLHNFLFVRYCSDRELTNFRIVQLMCSLCAAYVQLMYSLCTAYVQLMCSLCAAYVSTVVTEILPNMITIINNLKY